ncbi:MAG: dioxygenase, partial [Acetobacteraceae bacterium]|nr:dioxygenase [Acetobacteraceae bacterium]
MLPTVFVSHGAPDLLLRDVPARHFLERLGADLPRPRAIIAVTAHWETDRPSVGGAQQPATIHDFGNFDDRLFTMSYPAPGVPAIAADAADLLREAGIASELDGTRGLDHGVWVPLMLM